MIRIVVLLNLFVASAVAAQPSIKGVALGLYDHAEPDRGQFRKRVEEIRQLGATHVSLVVHWRQRDVRSNTVAPHRDATIPDDRLRAVIRDAKAQKLRVFLFPIIDLELLRPLEWRGTLAPRDIDNWWKSYLKFILHYARIAGEEGVDLFSVGSELATTESWRDRWYHLISSVKKAYRGPLIYSANWDHYSQVSFWERMDYVGVTGYYELSKSSTAEVHELSEAWDDARGKLVAFAKKAGKPLIITEVGYPSQDGAAVHPWDYTSRTGADPEEQRRCYEAFVTAWQDESLLEGVFWWIWWGEGGERDTFYTPRGKPAEKVLRKYFAPRLN